MKKLSVWLEGLRVGAMLILGSVLRVMTRESDTCPCCWHAFVRDEKALREDCNCECCGPFRECNRCGSVQMLEDIVFVCEDPACDRGCGYVRGRDPDFVGDICRDCVDNEVFAARQVEKVEVAAEMAEATA